MNCAICAAPMGSFAVGSVSLDRCPGCGALWFDRTELAATLRHHNPEAVVGWGEPSRATGHSNPPRCPRDGSTALHPYRWSAVNFWRCPACRGVLLRAGDWDAIVAAAETRPPRIRAGALAGADLLVEVVFLLLG